MTEEIIRGSRRIGSTVKNVQWFRRQPTGGTEYRRAPDPEPHATLGAVTDHMGSTVLNQSRRIAEVKRVKRSLTKKINRLTATCFGGCGATVENENEVCDACNKGPE